MMSSRTMPLLMVVVLLQLPLPCVQCRWCWQRLCALVHTGLVALAVGLAADWVAAVAVHAVAVHAVAAALCVIAPSLIDFSTDGF